jgi:hypothetical protein
MITWIKQDLAANPKKCTISSHHPLFSSGLVPSSDPKMKLAWEALYAANADVVINGHEHKHARFALQKTPSGVADPTRGIRAFVVGIGGRGLTVSERPVPTARSLTAARAAS